MPQIVKVNFRGTANTYHYICEFPVQIGESVVVDTPNFDLTCASVLDVFEYPDSRATKYVVQVVDMTAFKRRQEDDRRRKELEAELDRRMKGVEAQMRWKMLATMDPSAATLIDELEKLAA